MFRRIRIRAGPAEFYPHNTPSTFSSVASDRFICPSVAQSTVKCLRALAEIIHD